MNIKVFFVSAMLLTFSTSSQAQDISDLIELPEYVRSIKAQLLSLSKDTDGKSQIQISPIKVKLQAVVKKSAEGGISIYVIESDGKYDKSILQQLEFTIHPNEGNNFRAGWTETEPSESVHRFWRSYNTHFYTVSEAEKNSVIDAKLAELLKNTGVKAITIDDLEDFELEGRAKPRTARLTDLEMRKIAERVAEIIQKEIAERD